MMAQATTMEEASDLALSEGRKKGCDDISVLCSRSNESQVRFANNEITLVNNVRNLTLVLYITKNRKRILGATYNPTARGIESFVSKLVKSCESLPQSEDYVPLPGGPFKYNKHANFDPKVEDASLVEYVKQTIDEGLRSGAKRVSGSLNTETSEISVLTSAGVSGKDKETQILLNVRAFAEDNSSGQGLSCSSYVSDFHPASAGRKAGEEAKKSLNPKQLSDGIYDVIFSSTVVANILPIASSASAFAIESGSSFLAEKLDQKIAVEALTIEDYGVFPRGLGGRVFDDEGTPTQTNKIISEGRFVLMLQNCTTAKKFGKKSTGNAGIIGPRPTTIVFRNGAQALEEIIRDTKQGVLITNNWYTRYQNMRTGEYSTVPRDAAFRIEAGEIKEAVAGLRVSDSIPRQLNNIESISKERDWIRWWEVDTPTLAPAMKIKGVRITEAVGS
ncbi:MAG: TldD/PmbA family protein [Nitrososphaerota archaeon]|nr:TldD/PmbA family protein [Nitrososphaerota archaeon]